MAPEPTTEDPRGRLRDAIEDTKQALRVAVRPEPDGRTASLARFDRDLADVIDALGRLLKAAEPLAHPKPAATPRGTGQ